jgi:hypothetical protein
MRCRFVARSYGELLVPAEIGSLVFDMGIEVGVQVLT